MKLMKHIFICFWLGEVVLLKGYKTAKTKFIYELFLCIASNPWQ